MRQSTNDNVWPTRTGKRHRSGGPRTPVASAQCQWSHKAVKSTVSTVSLTEITHTSFPHVSLCARNYRVLNVAPAQGPIRCPYRLPL